MEVRLLHSLSERFAYWMCAWLARDLKDCVYDLICLGLFPGVEEVSSRNSVRDDLNMCYLFRAGLAGCYFTGFVVVAGYARAVSFS